MNGPAMSKDLAQRLVFIRLGKPTHTATWEENLFQLIGQNRWQIIADIAAFLQTDAAPLERCSRWGLWEREVLARLPDPSAAQRIIAERQAECDAENEEGMELEDYIAQKLKRFGYDPESDWVHIPNDIAVIWYRKITGTNVSTTSMKQAISQAADEQTLTRLRPNPSRTHGRGLLWGSGVRAQVLYDFQERARTYRIVGEPEF